MKKIRKNWKASLGFLLPALLLYTVFLFIPVCLSIGYAFTDWNGFGTMRFVGFDEFRKLFQDENFYIAIGNNVSLLLSSVFLICPIALILAVIISSEIKGYRFFRFALFLPQVLSTVVVSLIWSFFFNQLLGLLDAILRAAGLERFIHLWLADRNIAFRSVLVVNAWYYTGYTMVILLSAVNNIPREILEAAGIDGASWGQRITKITLPLIWENIKVAVLLGIAGSMKAFDLVYVLTKGGPGHSTELLATYLYKQSFSSYNYGYGSAISLVILVLGLSLSLLMQKVMKKEVIEY